MRPQDDIDYTTLAWVKGELDETLKQARQALEAYAEDPSDASQIRFCATYLHQVQGTLRIVELYAAAMVAEEMEQLAVALLEGSTTDQDEACAVLMRGIMQLPDYLERIQIGHKDVPIVLLPLLNDLRAARGETGLSQIVLFTPDLGRELPAGASGPAEPLPEEDLRQRAEHLRSQFQMALLKWFRNDDVDANLARLTAVCDKLVEVTSEIEARRLFWVTAGVLEALRAKAFEPSTDLKQTVGKVEREIKRLADDGEKSFRRDPPHELTRNLLYFVAHAPTEHGRIGELREVFRLGSLLPSPEEVEHARGSIAGHNRSLLDTVSVAIKEDVLRVKDALDLHLRNPDADAAQLHGQIEVLDRVSDTLGMLGLGVARRVVQEQRDAIRAVVSGTRAADEASLLDIAGALLYVEASLDEQVQHLGGVPAGAGQGAASVVPSSETRRVMQAVMKEAQTNFTRAKQCFVAYIESNWDADQLKDAPELLDQVVGAVRIIELPEPADYLAAIGRFTERELLGRRHVPDVMQMEALADALASLEYYLEAQTEQRPGRDRILQTARAGLEKLGYWPLPDESAVVEPASAVAAGPESFDADGFDATAALVHATDAKTTEPELPVVETMAEAAPVDTGVAVEPAPERAVEMADAIPAALVAAEDGPITGGFEAASEEIDAEIREVFVEEVEEEIGNLAQTLPVWMESPGELDRLKSIRRVFHTLKGSGRLVGALTLGELSWRVENMLNRVLDHTIQPTQAVVVLVRSAFEVLPELLAALRGEHSVHTDLEAMKDAADRIAAGEQVMYAPVVAAVTQPESALVDAPGLEPIEAVEVLEPATAEPMQEVPVVDEMVAADGSVEVDEPSEEVIAATDEEIAEEIAEEGGTEDVAEDDTAHAADVVATTGVAVAAIDTVLFDILQPEVSGHLDTVEAYLAAGRQPVTESLVRAVHTMNGAFAMTEVPVVTELTAPLESYLKRVLAHAEAPSPDGFRALDEAARALRNALVELDTESPRLTPLAELAMRITAERDLLPEALGPTVPTHLQADSGEMPALTSVVSMGVPDVTALDDMERSVAESLDAAVAPTSDAAEPDAAFDAAALAALGEEDVALTGVGMDGLVDEVETLLAGEDLDAEEIRAEEVQAEEVQAEEVQAEEVQAEEVQAEETQGEETQGEETQGEELSAPLDVEVVETIDWLQLPPLDEDVAADDGAVMLDIVEHDLSHVDAVVDQAMQKASDEAETPDVSDLTQPAAEVDALIRDWLAVETSASDEIVADDALVDEPIASDDELAPLDVQDESTEIADESEHVDTVDDAADGPESGARIEASGTVSADTFFESLAEDDAVPADADSDAERHEFEAEAEVLWSEESDDTLVDAGASSVFEQPETTPEEVQPAETIEVPNAAEAARAALLAAWFVAGLDSADPDPEGPLMLADMDEELLDIFVDEATDLLDHSDGLMARLRESVADHESVVALQRDLHTLKGGARMAGIYAIGDLGHVMESLLEIVADGKRSLPHYGIDVLEIAFDRLNRMTARVGARQALAMPVLLVQRVEMLSRGEQPTLDMFEPDMVEPALAEAEAVAPVAVDAAESVPEILSELAPTALDEEDVTVRTSHEQIRIRADLLDRLVNYAGEVAIYRARLEQQLGLFRSNLTELEQTVERLRGQLRKLDIETEAQIVARYQREAEMAGEETFDPLELDRFSTLQQLSRALSESAADLVSLQGTLEDHTRQYETLLLQQSRVSSDLQEGLMRTRMVPFDSLVPRMRRIIRQSAGELGKKAQLRVEGAQGEMDRSVLDRMTAPLEHMLRNAMAHGLEIPEERQAADKPEEGTIRIAFTREGSEVVIRISDDGRGLDRDAIRRKAIDRGLLASDATVSDQALFGFILESGFSTAATVSKIAGRGVGMDVVHSEIRQLGGSLNIDSERGRGTVFTVRLPFTLAVTQAVFVQQGDTSFAVPIASVQGVSRIERRELDTQLATGDPRFVYAGEDYAIHDLGRLLGQPVTRAEGNIQVPLLLARSGDLRVAICVDNVIGSREIVVKPVGAQVSSIPGIFGATIMGDGRVIVILDVAPLARRYAALHASATPVVPVPVEPVRPVPLVMVVDDSITMRKVTGRVLERHGYEVLTARDGVDAIEKLVDRVPDVMLLDIEMPRMDGYELATHMRNDVRLRRIPIIMITSRTGEKHRQRAFEIGVDRYLGKPYQESDLMRNVDEILKVKRGDLG